MLLAVVLLFVFWMVPIGLSMWLVARHGFGVRLVAVILALALATSCLVLFWVAGILNVGWLIFSVAIGVVTYSFWWLSRRTIDHLLEQARIQARW